MSEDLSAPQTPPTAPRWQPLGALDRRVLGVLAEKAKTTPDAYPMSLNGIATGCNQKSNRDPLMQLEPDDVAESLERLRQMGAVGMVEGYGRVTKYRHYLYDWLGIEKIELSVMTELLLRGAQTEGELRGRVSRMDPVPDLPALRTLLTSLEAKGLVLSLTPEGRGHVVSHALYTPRELEHLRAQHGHGRAAAFLREDGPVGPAPVALPGVAGGPADMPAPPTGQAGSEALRRDLGELREQIALVRGELQDLAARQERMEDDVRNLKDALGS
ncbi:MAG: DUF480 domain-containing protein [Thermoguttaceae bacterium]